MGRVAHAPSPRGEGERIRFQPANATMQPIYVSKADFRSTMSLGQVVGVYRKLPGGKNEPRFTSHR